MIPRQDRRVHLALCPSNPSNIAVSMGMNSLGTPSRLTFQARLLHNQEGANAEKGCFRKISSRAFFRRIGRCSHPLGCGAMEPGKLV